MYKRTTASLRLTPTLSSHCTGGVDKLLQLWADLLFGFRKDGNKITCFGCILRSKQRVCSSSMTSTTSAANAMDVVFRTVWVVKIDHKLHIVNI